jgi:hypothetical protein
VAFRRSHFFIERYLPIKGYIKRSLAELKLIAAHTVLMASELNPTGVVNLDMVLCRAGKPFELIGADEIAELTAESRRTDSLIAASLCQAERRQNRDRCPGALRPKPTSQ